VTTGLYENRIAFRAFDEDTVEILVEQDVDVGYVCAACQRRNCVEMQRWADGVEREGLKCARLMVVDGKHWRPVCEECVASFEAPRSTAAKLFGL
jgi:hypothetical protein